MIKNPKVEFYSRKEINKEYAKFLNNKKVALVGPARKSKNTKQKSLVDNYDIVVRINLGFNVPYCMQEDIGKRVDILYCALSNYYFSRKIISKKQMLAFKNEHDMKWFVATGAHRDEILKVASYNKKIKNGVDIRQISKKNTKDIKTHVSSKPTAGFSAICDLLSHNISELYITGFTFYNFMMSKEDGRNKYYYKGYHPDYLPHAGTVYKHDLRGEAIWLKNKMKKDKRIVTDKVLSKILLDLK